MNFIEKDNPKIIRAWVFYDWANSVFPLVITSAIFPNFYDAVTSSKNGAEEIIGHTISFFGFRFENQNLYSFVYAFALSIVVVIVPFLSGIADYLGNKKRFLQFFCYLGSLSCMALFFFTPDRLELSMIPFVTATVGFWGSLVYYNSYLPEIASPSQQDRVSARGFALGYFGSSMLLIACLALIIGLGKEYTRFSFLLVGAWWIGFAQVTFSRLPYRSHSPHGAGKTQLVSKGFRELAGVYGKLKGHGLIKRFLSGYFFYNMGVQTVMVMAVLFARNEIEWADEATKTSSLIISILIIQFVGMAGSFAFSRLSASAGNITSLMIAVLIWIFICVFTYTVVRLPAHFYAVAFLVGFVMGGIQALSRSTYSKLLPKTDDHASFFSFYDVIEKIGMILGTLTFGIMSEALGSMRQSILSLIVFFVTGFIILFTMRKSEANATDKR